jgi:ferredoxin--NADP+ reductase
MNLEVIEVTHYTDKLFRIKLERPPTYRFVAGEFTMIGFPEEKLKRAYSYTSGPYDDYLEFYSIKVPDGPLTSKLQHIEPGKFLYISDKPTGTLTLNNLELGGTLHLMATGTGIAPFISLLRDPTTYDHFDNIKLCWTVPYAKDLRSYNNFLEECDIEYLPTVTREEFKNPGRITKYIDAGMWDDITPKNDKVMICGSMEFNLEMKKRLEEKGFEEGNKRTAGTFTLEKAFVG